MGEDDLAPARVSATSHGGQALKSSIKLALMRFLGDYTDDVLVECVARLSSRPSVPCCREGGSQRMRHHRDGAGGLRLIHLAHTNLH